MKGRAMDLVYYPGCTMKSWGISEGNAVLEILRTLGLQIKEMERWPCCGAADPLVEENLMKMVAPYRILAEAGAISSQILTTCSHCTRVLRTVHSIVAADHDKMDKLEKFCEVALPEHLEVLHWVNLLAKPEYSKLLREKVRLPEGWLLAFPYPGCAMLRPEKYMLKSRATDLEKLLEALGVGLASDIRRLECCGAHQRAIDNEKARLASLQILNAASDCGCQAVVTACPLCRYNLHRANSDRSFGGIILSAGMVAAAALGIPFERYMGSDDRWARLEYENLKTSYNIAQPSC
jgi:heterodisulfide reductase subunit B